MWESIGSTRQRSRKSKYENRHKVEDSSILATRRKCRYRQMRQSLWICQTGPCKEEESCNTFADVIRCPCFSIESMMIYGVQCAVYVILFRMLFRIFPFFVSQLSLSLCPLESLPARMSPTNQSYRSRFSIQSHLSRRSQCLGGIV